MARAGGTLYLVATPIGNLRDISLRALDVLGQVDIVAAEDTRHTRKLLSAYNIRARMESYFEGNEREKASLLVSKLTKGHSVALVSNAGMPGISDPGYHVVVAACARGIPVVPVPGASAVLAALAASGLPTDRFVFTGFVPRGKTDRIQLWVELTREVRTAVLYESGRRLASTLREMVSAGLGERRIVIAREMTKLHEEFLRDSVAGMTRCVTTPVRGEVVLVVDGCDPEEDPEVSATTEVEHIVQEFGITKKEAVRIVATLRRRSGSSVYRECIVNEEKRADT